MTRAISLSKPVQEADVSQEDLLKRSTILIIDDERANVRILERMVERAGYVNVFGTTDTETAIEAYRELWLDVLLLGLHTPRLGAWS